MGLNLDDLIDKIIAKARLIDSDFPPLDVWDNIKATKKDIQAYVTTLETENANLRSALEDMFLLIDEHGGPTIKAHATRIMNARAALSGAPEKPV